MSLIQSLLFLTASSLASLAFADEPLPCTHKEDHAIEDSYFFELSKSEGQVIINDGKIARELYIRLESKPEKIADMDQKPMSRKSGLSYICFKANHPALKCATYSCNMNIDDLGKGKLHDKAPEDPFTQEQ